MVLWCHGPISALEITGSDLTCKLAFLCIRHEKLMIPELTISYDMWKNKEIEKYDLENLKISELIEIGYLDAYKNRKT